MTKNEEKSWTALREHRDALAKLASSARTGFFHKEDQAEFTRIGDILQAASDACDAGVLRLESADDKLADVARMRARLKDWRF